jgi:hypothetical protein
MRSEVAVSSRCVLLIYRKGVGLLLVLLSECLIVDSRSILFSEHFAVKSPRYCSAETQREKYIRYRNRKANIVKIRHETGSLSVLPTFFHKINCHSPQLNVSYIKV